MQNGNTEEGNDLAGVILAAGVGRRIRPLGLRYPKALLPVLGRPMIEWQLEALRRQGIEEVVCVIGYLGSQITTVVGDGSRFGVRVRYAEQDEPQGIAHALLCAESELERDFILLLGDIYFGPGDLEGMIERFRGAGADGVLAVQREDDPKEISKNFCVEFGPDGPDGPVRRVIEKPRKPASPYKGTGLYAFRLDFFDAVRRTPRSLLRNEYELTDAIQLFLEGGAQVRTFESKAPDFNLSQARDLLNLNLYALECEGLQRLVAPDAEVASGAVLERAIVLSGAKVEDGAVLADCLVFPGEKVGPGRRERTIFSAGSELGC